jgi:hypothetical protein
MVIDLAALRTAARIPLVTLLFALLLTSIEGCEKSVEHDQPVVISGQVFVVTQAGESVKLGLVPVSVFSPETIKEHIVERTSKASQEIAVRKPSLDQAQAALAPLNRKAELENSEARSLSDAESRAMAAIRRANAASNAFVLSGGEIGGADYERLEADSLAKNYEWANINEARRAAEARARLSDKLRTPKISDVARIEEEIGHFRSSEYLMENLPVPELMTKTDANGEFSLTLPRGGSVVVAATASRPAMNEVYYWLVTVSVEGGTENRILLSNDNLTTSSSEESLVHLPQ